MHCTVNQYSISTDIRNCLVLVKQIEERSQVMLVKRINGLKELLKNKERISAKDT
jgi:hypothetical protein